MQDWKTKLEETHDRIKPYIHRTPVMTSRLIDEICGVQVYFKGENFQKMGAFKMRGASNAMLCLTEEQRSRGVVTHSSGNMAQAVALAALSLGIKAHIVMPENAPQVKKNAVKDYKGEIHVSGNRIEDREALANELVEKYGLSFIHPSNDLNVILGQGTAAMELLEEVPDLDYILTPVGGGGLLAGTALTAKCFGQNCKTIAGEPELADDAFRSLKSGKIEFNTEYKTIADGLRTNLGNINFPIIQQFVDSIICVSEDEIIAAMKIIWERMKIVIEASSAVPFAALLKNRDAFAESQSKSGTKGERSTKIGIIISGGNVDLAKLPF